jgi:hypothetical protein
VVKTLIPIIVLAHVAHAGIRHVPPADAEAGSPVELVAEAGAATPTLVAHVRGAGQTQFTAIELVRRDDAHWVAVVPATDVATPGLAYYLDAGGEPVFASAEFPQALPVHEPDENQRKARDLVRAQNRRSRVHVGGEWVDFGTRTVQNEKLADNYYRIDADFSYRLLAYPLEQIRVGYTRLLGTTESMSCPTSAPCTSDVGFKVGGWFELGLAPIEGIRFDGRVMVMATSDGFGVGGGAEARLGDRDSSHIALGIEGIQYVGTAGYFRLGWGTVPGLPMAATVEVTNLPAPDRDTGVRLFYDVARDIGNGIRLGLRVGYAARVQTVAGITGGLGATVDF